MKKLYIIVVLLFFSLTFFGQQISSKNGFILSKIESDTILCKLKIINIKCTKRAYVIDACDIKDGHLYKIVSLKEKTKKCNKIKVDSEYEFVIWPYFNIGDVLPNQIITSIIEIKGVIISIPSDDWTSNIFITSDLIGLCYSISR